MGERLNPRPSRPSEPQPSPSQLAEVEASVQRQALLPWLNRHGRFALPLGILVGLVVPPLAQAMAPWLPWLVAGSMTLSLLRMPASHDPGAAGASRASFHAVVLTAWAVLACPLLLLWATWLFDVSLSLREVLVLHALAPPIGAVPAFALLLGLDARVAVFATVGATLLFPLVLTALAPVALAAGAAVEFATLGWRVVSLVLLPLLAALALRRLRASTAVHVNDDAVGGLNVLLLALLCVALMNGTGVALVSSTAAWWLLALAVGLTGLHHALAWVVFRALGERAAYTSAITAGNRNVALVLAAIGTQASEEFRIFAGLVQLPIFLAPLVVQILRSGRSR